MILINVATDAKNRSVLNELRNQNWLVLSFVRVTVFLGLLLMGAAQQEARGLSSHTIERTPSSVRIPRVGHRSRTNDILRDYSKYLAFVLKVGKRVDSKRAKKLSQLYSVLRRRDPRRAAYFLRGLKMELEHYTALSQISRGQATTKSPKIRRFVKKYIREWVREADEHLFRSIAVSRYRS